MAISAAESTGITAADVLAGVGSAAGALILAWIVLGLPCLGGVLALVVR